MGFQILAWLIAALQPAGVVGADLSLETPLSGALRKDEVHAYRVPLAAGQYARVAVRQEGGDIVVALHGPDGVVLADVASPEATEWPDPMSLVAETGGTYRIEVRSLGSGREPLRYEVRLEERREATPQDARRVRAERAFAAGERLTKGWENVPGEAKRRALESYREALALWSESDAGPRAKTLHRIGQTHASLDEPRKALEHYERALALRQALGDGKGEAATAHLMGRSHFRLEDYGKALESYGSALALRRALGDRRGEAMTLMRIADVHEARGDAMEAVRHYQQALALSREVGNSSGEVFALRGLAVAEHELGNADTALEIFRELRERNRASGDRRGEASILTQMANVYLHLGDSGRAIEVLQEALPLRRALGDRRGEGATLHDIARAHLQRHEFDKALEVAKQELAAEEEVGDRSGPASALAAMGRASLGLKRHAEALDQLERALAVFRTVGNRHWEAVVLEGLGEVHAALGNDSRALELHQEALALLGKGYPWWEATILEEMAGIARRGGDLALAQKHMEASLGVTESLRARVAGHERRSTFQASRQGSYESLIDLLIERHRRDPSGGFAAQALAASERARARMLLEVVLEARVDVHEGLDADLRSRERALNQRISAKEEQRGELLSGSPAGDTRTRMAEAEQELARLLAEYEDLQAEIRRHSPAYAALAEPRPLSLEDLQHRVLDEDSLLLEYALGDKRSFLFALTRRDLAVHELPPRREIEALARRAQEQLIRSQRREGRVPAQLALADLGRSVLGPVVRAIQGARRLVIVPDGALEYVPFAALPSAAGRPLVVSHEVVSLPSASALGAMRQELAGRSPASRTVAVLADPVFRREDPRVGRVAAPEAIEVASDLLRSVEESEIGRLERLSFSRQEAEAILSLTPAESRLGALDFDASRDTAIGPELADFRIVHFATHGILNSRHPELSGIVLSLVAKDGRPREGFLRLHDLYKLRLNADLVVLSACRTALGKEVRGEGLVGLTRGFMYAGSPRVVASLWNVRDAATAELMTRFYRGMLRQGLAPAAALRQAQVSMWKEPRFRAPYYWAGFVLQGEWK